MTPRADAKENDMTEPLTAHDYLSIARNMLWVAGEALSAAAGDYGTQGRPDYLNAGVACAQMVRELDNLRGTAVTPDAAVPVAGVVGIPPSESVQKLARLILESHRDSGGRRVTVGSSTWSCRLDVPPTLTKETAT